MKNNIKHGLLFLGASIICAILFLYLWNTQILDDVAIHNQLFSDKPVSGLDADDIDGFEDAIYPVRPEA